MKVVHKEPVLTAVLAFTVAVIAVLVAFGVNLSTVQQGAIGGLVVAGWGLAVAVRSAVRPTRKKR